MEPRQAAPPGMVVYGADDEPFGTITSSEADYIVVDSGGTPSTYYVPVSAIFESREDGLYLSATSADARRQGWDQSPTAEATSAAGDRIQAGSDYTAVQREDSLDEDPMPTPGEADRSRTGDGRPVAGDGLEYPSGQPGPERKPAS